MPTNYVLRIRPFPAEQVKEWNSIDASMKRDLASVGDGASHGAFITQAAGPLQRLFLSGDPAKKCSNALLNMYMKCDKSCISFDVSDVCDYINHGNSDLEELMPLTSTATSCIYSDR